MIFPARCRASDILPPARSKHAPLPHLVERLDGGLHLDHGFGRKLALIFAPAGFGKATGLTEWLDTLQGNVEDGSRIETGVVWLSLDEVDNGLARFLADGMTNPQIADRLFLSKHTVKAHTRSIYSKLDAHNRTQAVARGRALGFLPAD